MPSSRAPIQKTVHEVAEMNVRATLVSNRGSHSIPWTTLHTFSMHHGGRHIAHKGEERPICHSLEAADAPVQAIAGTDRPRNRGNPDLGRHRFTPYAAGPREHPHRHRFFESNRNVARLALMLPKAPYQVDGEFVSPVLGSNRKKESPQGLGMVRNDGNAPLDQTCGENANQSRK